MKLLTKFSIYNVVFSLLVFIIGGSFIYYYLYQIADHQTDESLRRDIRTASVKLKSGIPASDLETSLIKINPVTTAPDITHDLITDTTIYNPGEREYEPFRLIYAVRTVNHRSYRFIVMQKMLERNDVILTIFLSTLAVFLILVLLSSLSNIFISRRLWKPFHTTLDAIRRYHLSSDFGFRQSDTEITEFRELNTYIGEMITRIENEYNSLKEFTGNASHEMQTPLAIIRSKVELLSQSEDMNTEQAGHLLSLNQAVARMTKLFKALLLLTKLENRQFVEVSDNNLGALAKQLVSESEEFIQQKHLEIIYSDHGSPVMNMNPELAKIMLQNLISNAIRHNREHGTIRIETNPNVFAIFNTGRLVFRENPNQIFERFKKDPDQKGSIGLGLSIVRKICDLYGCDINYSYQNQWHYFEIIIPT